METLIPTARTIAGLLRERGQRLAVAESSCGGLISAALLAQPGASDYFLGGAVVYTVQSRSGLLGIESPDMEGIRPASEPYALLVARTLRDRLGADWVLAETGASGPTGNRYGDPAGHACLAVVGGREHSTTLATGSAERIANMRVFAAAGLALLESALREG